MPKSSAVVSPNLGIYLDRPIIALDPRMLAAGNNFRVKNGTLSAKDLGWTSFSSVTLNGRVTLVANFRLLNGISELIFGTPTDLYSYHAGTDTVTYLTPRYDTGTASASGTAVTGVGTAWLTFAKPGDEITFGAAGVNSTTATWYTVQSVTNDLAIVLTASAGVVANGPYTLRRKFTAGPLNIWETETFAKASPSNNDEWWATNGVDPIVRWDGLTDQVEQMDSLNFTAKSIVIYKNMMIFLNLIQGGQSKPTDMINSQPGEPQNVFSALSQQFRVHGGTDEVLKGAVIGDNLALYSKNRVILSQFIGGDEGFIFRQAMTGLGLIGSKALADFGNSHEFLANRSQFTFDGVTVKERNKHVWREILRNQDPVRSANSYSLFDDKNGELLWVVPSLSDPNHADPTAAPATATVEHFLEDVPQGFENPFSFRDMPFTSMGAYTVQEGITWDSLTGKWNESALRWNEQTLVSAFPVILTGDANGKIWEINTSQNANGAALVSFVRFGQRPTVDGNMRGLITRVIPFLDFQTTPVNVTLRLGDFAGNQAAGTQTDVYSQNYTPEGYYFVTPYRRARFMQLEFGTTAVSSPWVLSGYDINIRPGGKK